MASGLLSPSLPVRAMLIPMAHGGPRPQAYWAYSKGLALGLRLRYGLVVAPTRGPWAWAARHGAEAKGLGPRSRVRPMVYNGAHEQPRYTERDARGLDAAGSLWWGGCQRGSHRRGSRQWGGRRERSRWRAARPNGCRRCPGLARGPCEARCRGGSRHAARSSKLDRHHAACSSKPGRRHAACSSKPDRSPFSPGDRPRRPCPL